MTPHVPGAPILSRRTLLATPALPMARPARAQDAVLRVVSPWEFDSADPVETGYILRRLGIGETLVGVKPDGQLVGLLAERWAVDPDRLTWRITLRTARFHDGTPLTVSGVVATLERVRSKAESLSAIPLAEMYADSKTTVVIRTHTPFASLPAYLTDYAGVMLSPNAYDADGTPRRPIATGPYRVTALGGARTLDAEAFADYWGGTPAIARLRYTAVPLGDTRARMAEAGEADLAFTLLPQAAGRIEAAGRGRVLRATIPRVRMLAMNLALPQFSDVRVRRALSLAIDREGIATAILRHRPSAATQLLPPDGTGSHGGGVWHDETLPPLRRDLVEAKRLLADAGWIAGADGVLVKGGHKLQATMLAPSNRPELPVMAQALQAQFREIGVTVEVRPGPSNALPGAIRDGSLQMALVSRTYVNVPDPIGTIRPDFAGEVPVWASPGYVDAAMRQDVQAYLASFDDAERRVLRKRIAATLQDQLPVIPVSWSEHNAFVSTRVALPSVMLDPFEQSYGIQALHWA